VARRSSIRYFESRGGYYTQLRGQQHKLATGPDDAPDGPTFQEASRQFWQLLCKDQIGVAGDSNSLRTLCEAYVTHIATRRGSATLSLRHRTLKDFVDFEDYGEMTVRGLTHHHVYRFFQRMQEAPPARKWRARNGREYLRPGKRWGGEAVRVAAASLKAALNWAVKSGLIPKNPLHGLELPSPRSRGREALLGNSTAEVMEAHRKILDATPPSFHPFLTLLKLTGARPSEITNATAADFDPALGAIVYHAEHTRRKGETGHKTGGKGKTRTILLTGDALAIVRDRVQRYPTGPLFAVNEAAKPGQRRPLSIEVLCHRFKQIREKTGLKSFTPYSYRHTFATEWLKAGKSIDVLAAILGNSPAIIRKHYSHLLADPGALRLAIEGFNAGREGSTQTPPAGPTGDVGEVA
jgi:integrase